jgi:hypothetical protein
MALSHFVKLSLDFVSRVVIVLDMPDSPSVYHKAFEEARRELAVLIATQEQLEKKKIELRKTIEALGALCKVDNIEVQPSAEAAYILAHSTMPEEIKRILKSQYPAWIMPGQVKTELEKLGHDLSKYSNAQATIHMVLKRMTESDNDVQEIALPNDGRKAYRCVGPISAFQKQVIDKRKQRTAASAVADFMKTVESK